MSVKVGDKIPAATLYKMGKDGPEGVSTADLFSGKKVVVFAVPGAFTPTCSESHLPSFIMQADALKAKGVDSIVCVSVNDVFVMSAWGEQKNVGDIQMLADGSAELTKALGTVLDLTDRGLGVRSDRYAMIVDNGVVSHFAQEEPGQFDVSSADAVLKAL